MKKFVIRHIGWIFDDDWYNFDKESSIQGVYNSKEEAIKKKRSLDYESFLSHSFYLHQYQYNYNWQKEEAKFIDVQKIAIYLSKKLNVHKHQIIDRKSNQFKNHNNILSKTTEDHVAEILNITNLEFFRIIEFDSEDIFFYYTKKNPDLWESKFDPYSYNNLDHFYYYVDESFVSNKRISKTIKECYEIAITDTSEGIVYKLIQYSPIQGDLDELSNTPSILESIIEQSKNISYDSDKKIILFKKELTADELMALDAVLIHPVLSPEKVSIDSLDFG